MTPHDFRYALRSLARSPGFVVAAVLSLALGLGLVTTMFALLDAVTHPYVPYRDAERLYGVSWRSAKRLPLKPFDVFTFLRDESRSFEAVLPVVPYYYTLMGREVAEGEVAGTMVPGRFFSLLGVRPRLGRTLSGLDAGRPVAVVSDDLWRRKFAGRRSLAGATVSIDHRPYDVVGVMPRGMDFPNSSVWIAMSDEAERTGAGLTAVATLVKLKPGVSRERADSDLANVAHLLTTRFAVHDAPFWFNVHPLRDDPMRLGDIHVAMLGASLAVLLIACANLANLMLARGLAKRREVALRLAIGASRAAVVRQMFLECALLTVAGAAAGAMASYWGVGVLSSRIPGDVWYLGIIAPQLSWRVFVLSAVAAAGSAVLFGLLPAIRVANAVSLDEPLKDGAGTTGRTKGRYSALVVSEVALALALMMGAGLLLRVVHRLRASDYDFPARQLLNGTAFGNVPSDSAAPEARVQFALAAVAAVRTANGVVDVAASSFPTLPGNVVSAEMGDSNRFVMNAQAVTPSYLRTMGLPVLQGRDFADGDLVGNGAAIVNTAAAAALYPRGSALGRMVKLGRPTSDAPWVRIVGVCRTAMLPHFELTDLHADPWVYVVRAASFGPRIGVLVRTAGDPQARIVEVQRRFRSVAPGADVALFPYMYWLESALAAREFLAKLFVTMGSFALVLAAVGVYGVMAYAVTRRLREFAVRVALGARRDDLVKAVMHDALVMTLAGTGLGAFVALWTSYFLENVLENVYPTDAVTLVVAEAVLLAVTIGACLAPAFRAAKAYPIEILRAT